MGTESRRNIRITYDSYMESKTDLSKAIETIEEFIGGSYITVSKDLDEYISGYKDKRRIAIVVISNFAIRFSLLRFGISGLLNRESVRIGMFDFYFN